MISMRNVIAGCTLFGALVCGAIVTSCNASDSTRTHTESAVEQTVDANTVFIDVRTPDEFASGHVEGALNIPVSEIELVQEQVPDKDAQVVLYCRSGNRAGRAMKAMLDMGYTDVMNAGGVSDAQKVKDGK